MLSDSPKARAILYWISFAAAAAALFATLIPEVGSSLASALAGLAALAQTFATATAISNISPAPQPDKSP